MSNKFYVYAYVDNNNNLPVYIGKGEGYRAIRHQYRSSSKNSKLFEAIQNSNITLCYLAIELSNDEARAVESSLITLYSPIYNNRGGRNSKNFFSMGAQAYLRKEPKPQQEIAKVKVFHQPTGIVKSLVNLLGIKIAKDIVASVDYNGTCTNSLIHKLREQYNIRAVGLPGALELFVQLTPAVFVDGKTKCEWINLPCDQRHTCRKLRDRIVEDPTKYKFTNTIIELGYKSNRCGDSTKFTMWYPSLISEQEAKEMVLSKYHTRTIK